MRTAHQRAPEPELSYAAAQQQAVRVAASRQLQVAAVRHLVDASTQQQPGGAPRVNLVALNLALDLAAASLR